MEQSRANFYNQKDLKRWFAFVVAVGLVGGGCRPTQGREPTPTDFGRLASIAKSEVVYDQKIPGGLPTAVYVKYLSDDGASPECSLEIFENSVAVAKNSEMVECGLMSSPTMVSVKITGTVSGLVVFQQKVKGTNSYFLRKTLAGEWVVEKAEFVFPRDNLETGEVDLVRETADLHETPIPLNSYSAAAIKGKLVESTVK
jgi:hypothetical protein